MPDNAATHPAAARILVVEDDRAGGRLVAALLEGEGHTVCVTETAAAALAEAMRELPDLILMDIMMPGMDGFGALERLKSNPHTQAVPVVMLTALEDRTAKLRALECGAVEFLTKPVDRADLLVRVRNLLQLDHYRRLAQERAARLEQEVARRRLSEASLVQANAQLRMTNQELEDFAHSASHDLRRPVRAIEGFAALLTKSRGEALDTQSRENLQRIEDAAQDMNRLIEDLICLARVTAREMHVRAVNLSALALKIAATLRQTDAQRQVVIDIQPELMVRGDAGLLQIALTNLFDNAWKFTRNTPGAHIAFGCRAQDGETIFFVRDNGVGFDMRRVDMLFQPFRRLHSVAQFPGEGIGLATVRRVVTRHDGRVWAEGEPGKGATFFFTLP